MKPSFLKLTVLLCLGVVACLALSHSSFSSAVGDAVGRLMDKKLDEASGLVASRRARDVFWVHNDGKVKRLYAVNAGGSILDRVSLKSVAIDDLEDIAAGPGPEAGVPYLYLGDIGDNDLSRDNILVLRFPEPDLPLDTKRPPAGLESFALRYPDGSHDAEALLVDPWTGDLFLVTKGESTRIYTVSAGDLRNDRTVSLRLVDVLPQEKISAGDIAADGRKIVLRNETDAWLWRRAAGDSVAEALSRAPIAVPVVGPPEEPNGEAIAIDLASAGYYTLSEGEGETIYYFANVLCRRSAP